MADGRETLAGFGRALAAFAVSSLSLAGCEAAPTQAGVTTTITSTTTTTWGDYSCVVDRVVVDPDDKITALEPGCAVVLEAQAFGPGGSFDVCAWDDAGGFGGACGWNPISVLDGERFTVEYTPGDELGSEVLVAVALEPHSPYFVCTGDAYGATGYKTFPRADGARDCVVTFRVTDEIDLGEIIFTVGYSASDCEVGGCGGGVACKSPVSDWSPAWPTASDWDERQELYLKAARTQGFSTPTNVYRCDLQKHGGAEDPSPGDFVVSVLSARSPPPLSKALTELPSIEVAVDCELGPTTTTTLPFEPASCGHPCSAETSPPTARDALYIAGAAVGARTCKTCICDVNRSGIVDATDALTVLARAVGFDALVRCVLCAEPIPLACQ